MHYPLMKNVSCNSEVLTVAMLNIQIFWDVTLCQHSSSRTTCQMTQASYPRRFETSFFPPFEALLVFIMKGTFPAKWKQIDIPGNKQQWSRVCQNISKTSPNLSDIGLTQRI
jgi:hypothetical protein